MFKVLFLASVTLFLGLMMSAPRESGFTSPDEQDERAAAIKLLKEGNFSESLEKFRALLSKDRRDGAVVAEDWNNAVQCLVRLQRIHELDGFLEETVNRHGSHWQLLHAAAGTLMNTEHYGFIIAGKFVRGQQRGGGVWVNATENDRVRALQLLSDAMPLIDDEANGKLRGQFWRSVADSLMFGRQYGAEWKLQDLTDLAKLPDLNVIDDSGMYGGPGFGWGADSSRGAPVDEKGNPVFYSLPESWKAADSDGSRWRWAWAEAGKADPDLVIEAQWLYVQFLHQQFGVRSLQRFGINLASINDESQERDDAKEELITDPNTNPFALRGLTDEETIAKLATGVRRFRMPDEHNPVLIARQIAESSSDNFASQAISFLATVYADRQQYPKAAAQWQRAIGKFGTDGYRNAQLDQIVLPWGMLESTSIAAAGQAPELQYRFRNGKSVEFTARKIDQQKILADTINYLSGKPQDLDWNKFQLEQYDWQLLDGERRNYVGEIVAKWNVELQPRNEHFDRRVTVQTPLQQAGVYLVTAKMKDGNESHIVVCVDSLALLKKPVANGMLYYLANADDGSPVAGADVEFFGWQQRWNQISQRSELVTRRFAERTDASGFVKPDSKLYENGFQWLAMARTRDGKTGWLGYSYAWSGNWDFASPERSMAYLISDRPIYRPGQTVQYKIWIRETSYKSSKGQTRHANEDFMLTITDPQGNEIRKESARTDASGNIAGELALTDSASLGQWSISISGNKVYGGLTFRVEEYKKPEFEVTIDLPETPVQLGDSVKAKIRANYYFGGPVTNATVKYKVQRTAKSVRWFPVRRWDWLYGNGYWWFAPENEWYRGFSRWGCYGPVPPWWGGWAEPPELVLDEETEIAEDGTAEITIDTQLAKALHGDQDHQYTITAEVVDASRRTIVGTGSVTVARQPWRVYTWIDRGYARVGENLTANFQTRTPDGKGVAGTAEIRLIEIRWKDESTPEERIVQSWPGIRVDESGQIEQVIQASQPGQFRIACIVDDGQGNKFEGAQLLTITGDGFDSNEFRFNDLEVTLDKAEYTPGETARLLINTNRPDSTVLLWIRPVNGVCRGLPEVLKLNGKSAVYDLKIDQADMPNFFIEAVTISRAGYFSVIRNIFVPPADKTMNVSIEPSQSEYLPGAEATLKVKLTDETGEPVRGEVVLTMYDRALEYISGGSNVGDAREFFWKWVRSHNPNEEHSLSRKFYQFVRSGDKTMQFLGVFGYLTADQDTDSGMAGSSRESRQLLLPPGAAADGPAGGGGRGGGRMGIASRSFDAAAESAAPGMGMANAIEKGEGSQSGLPLATATVRTNFADSAVWRAGIATGIDGTAEVKLTMPENLTAWKIRSWAIGADTRVGDDTIDVTTKKNIMVRLQAPRFFVERDEIVLSAIVHNYLDSTKTARVSLDLSGETLAGIDIETQSVEIPAGGDVRVDWRVKATTEGTANITMTAETDVESDAMKMSFPVFVHGMLKTESYSQIVRNDDNQTTIEVTVPADRRPEQTRLEIRFSPTLAGAMVDALPYLVEYPYGCTEQTLNRFVPTVVTLKTLRSMNLDLKAIRDRRNNLNAGQIGNPAERAAQWRMWDRNPVFDQDEVELMVKTGIRDLTAMQCRDGGWGWFAGVGERSWPHTTAVVVHGLQTAAAADVAIPAGVVERGLQWLKEFEDSQIALLDEWIRLQDLPQEKRPKDPRYKTSADNLDSLVHMVLTDAGLSNKKMTDYLYRDRTKLTLYGLGTLGLSLDKIADIDRRDMCLRNMDQFVVYDEDNQTAFIDLPNNGGSWWYWYGDVIEANAIYLKLMSRVRPEDPKTAGVVKYLLNNRRFGTRWNSTRDTALCIEAMSEYLARTGENKPEMTIEVLVDGQVVRTVDVNEENILSFDNVAVLEGQSLESGLHKVEVRRKGKGPVYVNAWMTNFTLEDNITAAGLEIKVDRKYYRLDKREDATGTVRGDRGQVLDQKIEKYDRVELASLDELKSGDLVEVELEIDSKNDYEYVIFEDMKGAGFEPVETLSGYTPGGLGAYVQFRDENVAFFMRSLARGKHSVSYRMRAEIPGKFSALPAKAWAMYAPELKGNSDEIRLNISDNPRE